MSNIERVCFFSNKKRPLRSVNSFASTLTKKNYKILKYKVISRTTRWQIWQNWAFCICVGRPRWRTATGGCSSSGWRSWGVLRMLAYRRRWWGDWWRPYGQRGGRCDRGWRSTRVSNSMTNSSRLVIAQVSWKKGQVVLINQKADT